jgi:heat shock protein HslJ
MKTISLIFTVSISILACNQSEDKEIGTYEPVNTATNKPDTTTATTKITNTDNPAPSPAPDTTAKKTIAPAPNETLQNFWVLESVDGKPLNPKDFPNGTPYFELNVKKNKISGHAGCNGINGSIEVQGNNILFGNLITTKATCSAQDFENRYLNGLSGHKVPYTIEGTKLYLTVAPESKFVYRKIQQ